jgi:hypothetical protein
MSTHKILATIPVGDPDAGAEVELMITFDYTPGSPDTYDASRGGPGGWDPGYPAEISFVKAERYCNGRPSPPDHAFADMEIRQDQDIAESWLDGKGYDDAIEVAEYDSGPDPDDARDEAIERRMMERDE